MKTSSLGAFAVLCVHLAQAGKFRVPVDRRAVTPEFTDKGQHGHDGQAVIGAPPLRDDRRHTRMPLPYSLSNGVSSSLSLPVTATNAWTAGPQSLSWLIYLTIVGVGTSPVQMFRAVIDLNWADMFVPSAACPSCRGHLTYNSSRSPTYEANGTEVHEHYGGLYSDGIVSVDTVTLGDGLEIKHQPFEEVMSWRPVPGYWEDSFDSVLGLAAGDPIFDDPYMPHVLPGPFATMASQGTLDENMVSLLLPHDDRVAGDIMFGGYDENLFKGKLSAHPLYPSNTTHWQVESTAVYLADQSGRMLVNESLAGYPAVLEVGYPYILLPVSVGEKITNATTPDRDNDCHVPSIPCDQVAQLPHLTFNLGGHHYTLTGEDYIVRTQVPFCGAKYYCVPIVGGASGVEDMIVLGSSFLKRFYSVYNLDTRTIHLAEAKPKSR